MSLHLSLLPADVPGRAGRDRLELLTALIAAPGFDPLYRSGLIRIPPGSPGLRVGLSGAGCECVGLGPGLCTAHEREWKALGRDKVRRADFTAVATPVRSGHPGSAPGRAASARSAWPRTRACGCACATGPGGGRTG